MKEFYVISASEIDGVPLFFDLEWVPQLPEFNKVVENPERAMFSASYEAKVELDKFDVDVLFEQYIASSDFISLCDWYKCSYFSVPVTMKLRRLGIIGKSYSFFCVLSRCSLLDIDKSQFLLMDEGLLRPAEERQGMPPVYERIEKFAIRPDIEEDLFYCEELKQMVCSAEFKNGYLERGLIGLEFEKIDSDFVYAPWE